MAGNFYTLEEAAQKLEKTENEIQKLVKEGKLREFRDGTKVLIKKEELDQILEGEPEININLDDEDSEVFSIKDENDTGNGSVIGLADDSLGLGDESIGLAETGDASDELEQELKIDETKDNMESMIELSEADTRFGEAVQESSINILGESDAELNITKDTASDTQLDVSDDDDFDLGRLDAVNTELDGAGSGSGLLDLSLQADDTSLGAVLDDILPGAGGDEAGAGGDIADMFASEDSDAGANMLAASADTKAKDASAVNTIESIPTAIPASPAMMVVQGEPEPGNNLLGIMMFIPFIAALLAVIATFAGAKGINPITVRFMQGYMLYVVIGMAVVSLILAIISFVIGSKSVKK